MHGVEIELKPKGYKCKTCQIVEGNISTTLLTSENISNNIRRSILRIHYLNIVLRI